MSSRISIGLLFIVAVGLIAPTLFTLLIGIDGRYIPFSNLHRTSVEAAGTDPEDPDAFFGFFDRTAERWPAIMLEVAAAGVLACIASGAIIGRFARQLHPGWSALVAVLPLVFGITVGRSLPIIALMIVAWPLAGIFGAWMTGRTPKEAEEADPAPS